MEFLLQPNVYSTGVSSNLLSMLDHMWLRDHVSGNGCLYIISGFSNYNGGVRFYPSFIDHTRKGGKIIAVVGGSTSQRLSSIQVAEALLNCGVELYVVNRKRLVHAKCYGVTDQRGEELVVTSGNFTGPGMSQNAEAAVRIDQANVSAMGFSWGELLDKMFHQGWDIYRLEQSDIIDKRNPGWTLLYDEVHDTVKLDDSQLVSMVVLLSHSDTARIQATPGTSAYKGTQYFWLSKASFDFFPALTEKNRRGIKNTYSCLINMNYIDLGITKQDRVTFEADNNLDFRLGTAAYRGTRVADERDLAIITRRSEYDYEIRIIPKTNSNYALLLSYAPQYIGGQGKRFGYIGNSDLFEILNEEGRG